MRPHTCRLLVHPSLPLAPLPRPLSSLALVPLSPLPSSSGLGVLGCPRAVLLGTAAAGPSHRALGPRVLCCLANLGVESPPGLRRASPSPNLQKLVVILGGRPQTVVMAPDPFGWFHARGRNPGSNTAPSQLGQPFVGRNEARPHVIESEDHVMIWGFWGCPDAHTQHVSVHIPQASKCAPARRHTPTSTTRPCMHTGPVPTNSDIIV